MDAAMEQAMEEPAPEGAARQPIVFKSVIAEEKKTQINAIFR